MTIRDAEAQRQMLLSSLENWGNIYCPSTEEGACVSWRSASRHTVTTDSEEAANKAKEWLSTIESQLESN